MHIHTTTRPNRPNVSVWNSVHAHRHAAAVLLYVINNNTSTLALHDGHMRAHSNNVFSICPCITQCGTFQSLTALPKYCVDCTNRWRCLCKRRMCRLSFAHANVLVLVHKRLCVCACVCCMCEYHRIFSISEETVKEPKRKKERVFAYIYFSSPTTHSHSALCVSNSKLRSIPFSCVVFSSSFHVHTCNTHIEPNTSKRFQLLPLVCKNL